MKLSSLSATFLACLALFSFSCASSSSDEPGEDVVSYTVRFDSRGGSAVASQTVRSGTLASRPADPVKSDSSFGGWYRDSSLTAVWNFSLDTVTSDMTLYAKWIATDPTDPVLPTFLVSFDSRGGSAVASQTVASGGKVSKPADPTRADYAFAGWFREEACATPWDFSNDVVTADRLLYAKWFATTGSGGITVDPFEPVSVILELTSGDDIAFSNAVSASASATLSLVPAEIDSWAWFLDGVSVPGATTASFSGGTTLTRGPHTIMVVAVKDGVGYSAAKGFVVR